MKIGRGDKERSDMYALTADEIAAFRNSGEFDERWYLEQYDDVRMLGMDAAEHFLWLGKRLGRQPNPSFSQHVRQEAKDQILRTFAGEHPATDSLCLFSHYDEHARIDDYVITYLKALVDCGFSVVFITTSDAIPEREIAKITQLVSKVIVKKNVGRDFGSWFAGVVDSWKFNRYRRVLLANDSVYGPLFDLKFMFDDMGDRSLDLWGITDSFEVDYHLQSYFVVFEAEIVNSGFFTSFWSSYTFEIDKRKVIDNYEVGLTALARKSGYRVGALCSYYDVRRHALRLSDDHAGTGLAARQSRLTPVNPSHFFWRALIQNCHCPFVKIELLRDNPSAIDDVFLWRDTIKTHSTFEADLIDSHLRRVCPA
jgi:rhamnosyltransferase